MDKNVLIVFAVGFLLVLALAQAFQISALMNEVSVMELQLDNAQNSAGSSSTSSSASSSDSSSSTPAYSSSPMVGGC